MRVHYFQHVPFEQPGTIFEWAAGRGHTMNGTHFYRGDALPDLQSMDMLVVMGGPMNIYEEKKYPWLKAEKTFIKSALDSSMPVLGICLGAQLLADCLGATVFPGDEKEIGWFPISMTAQKNGPFQVFPDRLDVFHWHGDTFELPEGAVRTASSKACLNQAFFCHNHAAGLQFHLEMDEESIQRIMAHSRDELVDGPFIQNPGEMIGAREKMTRAKKVLFRFLDAFVRAGTPE